jgi:hypothetical protein
MILTDEEICKIEMETIKKFHPNQQYLPIHTSEQYAIYNALIQATEAACHEQFRQELEELNRKIGVIAKQLIKVLHFDGVLNNEALLSPPELIVAVEDYIKTLSRQQERMRIVHRMRKYMRYVLNVSPDKMRVWKIEENRILKGE